MKEELIKLLPHVSKPGRYMGDEINSVKKNIADIKVKIALAFPDLYEIGISNLGLQILYKVLNDREDIAAERVYAPWEDMEKLLREKDLPLYSLESFLPLRDFEIVGFSLQHELVYTNLLNMLELGEIPLLSSQRKDSDPLIIAGGPTAFNPEPIADFVDAFLIGDGEDGIIDICDIYQEWKKGDGNRKDLLISLAKIEGVYVPSLFSFQFHDSGKIKEITTDEKTEEKVKRRILTDLDSAPYPTKFIVPNIQPVHHRIPLEVARGCSRFCRFCQAGYIYLPVRERSPQKIRDAGAKALKETGIDEVALLSLSTGDYSCLETLLPHLVEEYNQSRTKISFPSLRVDTMTPAIMGEMKKAKLKSFTIAPEAGSQRLRDMVNKCVTEDQILETTKEIAKAGCQSIKLYFMIGLPTETKEDLDEIITLSRAILKVGKKEGRISKITINLSTFVPKSHTPFQWVRQNSLEETRQKLSYLKQNVKDRQLSLKWQAPEMSILEGLFSRGNRTVGKVILKAFKDGARFDGWGELMKFYRWEDAFKSSNLSMEKLIAGREESEILPWDCIDIGIEKSFLLEELNKSSEGASTEDCRYAKCCLCGVCDHKIVKIEQYKEDTLSPYDNKKILNKVPQTIVRVKYEKRGKARFLGHIDSMDKIMRMLRKTDINIAYSQGFKPAPKISFSSPIPLGTESLAEYFDVNIEESLSSNIILQKLRDASPPNFDIIEAKLMASKGLSLTNLVEDEIYLITIPAEIQLKATLQEGIDTFTNSTNWPIEKKTKKGIKQLDLKLFLKSISTKGNNSIELILDAKGGRRIKADDALASIYGLSVEDKKSLGVLKTDMTLGSN